MRVLFCALAAVLCLQAGDIPTEFAMCTPEGCPSPYGAPGTIGLLSGLGEVSALNSSPAGSALFPWTFSVLLGGNTLSVGFTGADGGHPLRNWTNLNATGSNHWAGRYFALQITNDTGYGWSGVNLAAYRPGGVSSEDGISFGQISNCAPGGPQAFECGGVSWPFSGDPFSAITFGWDPLDTVSFTGAFLPPGETAMLLFAITDGEAGGAFTLDIAAEAVPEPATILLAALGLCCCFGPALLRRRLR